MMLVQCKVHLCNPVKVLWVNREVKLEDRVKVEGGLLEKRECMMLVAHDQSNLGRVSLEKSFWG